MTIKGNVIDTNFQQPVRNAVAMAIRVKDSMLLGFQRTDASGAFRFSFAIDTVQLLIRHPQYGDYNSYFFGSAENREFEINPLPMPDKSTSLGEVVVFANREPIYYRGDTLVYVADSFQVKENAVVEDLLKKLPGIKIDENGKITSQGQEIGQVLVDGDEFFGSDPTIATKNLAAKGVETVQVYEKDSEDGSDEKIQVLDLKLKEEAKKGYFGKTSLAGGLDQFKAPNQGFYEGDFLFNKYNSKQKIAVFGMASNTPKSDFGWEDMNKFGIDGGGQFWEESDDGFNWQGQEQTEGIPQTLRTGFYLDQKLWKGARVRLNYSYSDNRVNSVNSSRSQYFLTDTTYTTDVFSEKDEHYQKHQIGVKFTQDLDSTSKIEFEPKINLSRTTQTSNSTTNFISATDTLTRFTTIDNDIVSEASDINTTVRYSKNFSKKNRKLTARYNLSSNLNSSDGFLLSEDVNAQTGVVNASLDQKKENRNNSVAHTGFVQYVEPFGKKWKTELEYEYYRNDNDQRKTTFTPVNGSYTQIDSVFSNQFETNRQQHRVGAFAVYENAKVRVSVGTRVRTIGIDNTNIFTDTLIRQGMTNLLPRVNVTYRITNSNRLRFQYTTTSSLPTISQLQPVPDNSNPNFVRIGNADLKPNYVHNMNLNYNMWKGLSGFYVYSGMSYTYQQNAFSSSTLYDDFGRTVSQSINVPRADYAYMWAGAGIPIPKVKDLRLDVSLNGNYTSTESRINTLQNLSRNFGLTPGAEFRYGGDTLEFSLGANWTYNVPSSSLNTSSNQPYSQYVFTADVDWTLPLHLRFMTDVRYTINTQRTVGYDLNFFIWNASIMRSFLKTENLSIGIEAYDILNQNISANRDITDNVITDSKTNIITRFFMAKMVLKFNNNHTKESDDEMW